jgi:hypothetical protein
MGIRESEEDFEREFNVRLSNSLKRALGFLELLFSKKILAEFDLPINLEGEKFCTCHSFDMSASKDLSQVNEQVGKYGRQRV